MSRAQNRPKRTPVGQRNIMTTDQRDGFVRRWVNDVDGRLSTFEAAGYKAVDAPTSVGDPAAGNASQVGSVVRKPVGGGVTAVLMEIPKEFYDEDQAAKEQHLKAAEGGLLNEAKGEGYYGSGVSVKRGLQQPGITIE